MATGISDDMIMMFVIHDALRRDLDHLTRAVARSDASDPARREAVEAGWNLFKGQLHHHHTGEDKWLWPRGCARIWRTDPMTSRCSMRWRRSERIVPAIAGIDTALADPDSAAKRLPEAAAALGRELVDHLSHEACDAVPLIESVMTRHDWREFSPSQQKATELKGAVEFFPSILSGADPERGAQVLGSFPPPLSLLICRVWIPRYGRRALWS